MTIKQEHARFLGAMFITILASQATMVVDASVGGNLLGEDVVSAVDLVMPVYEVFYALVMFLGMGACTIASVCLGSGDVGAVRKHFTAAVVSSLVVMLLMGIGIFVFQNEIVELLCGDSYLRGFTRVYLVAMIPYFIIGGLQILFMIFTAMAGRPGLVMWCAIVQFAVNVTCNLLLLNYTGLGIESLAYSSALSSIVTAVLLWFNYRKKNCPFRMIKCSWTEFVRALGCNMRYGSGLIIVNMAYVFMAYTMNMLVLQYDGEQGLFFWSIVIMIYLTGDYASAAAQDTSLSLGGRLLGAGDKVGFRMIYNRSLVFTVVWIGLILVGVFVFPKQILPLYGATEANIYPNLLKTVAWAIPFIMGVSIGNLFLVRLLQKEQVMKYILFSSLLFVSVPLWYFLQHVFF